MGIPHVMGHALHIPHLLEEFLHSVWVHTLDMPPALALMEWVLMAVSVATALLAALLSYLMNVVEPARSQKLAAYCPESACMACQ